MGPAQNDITSLPITTTTGRLWHMQVSGYANITFTFASKQEAEQACAQAILTDTHLAVYLTDSPATYAELANDYREGNYGDAVARFDDWYGELDSSEIPCFGVFPAIEATPNPDFSLDAFLAPRTLKDNHA